MTDTPWDPPLQGTEAEQLLAALDRLRATFRYKADGLDAAGLSRRIGASTLTLGGLLKHLALVEDHQFGQKLTGAPLGHPWSEVDWDATPDWEFETAAGDSPRTLYELWDAAVARSRERVGQGAGRRRTRPARPRQHRGGARQPAAARLRHDRGVRPAHRARRPDQGGGRRPDRRGPVTRLEADLVR